VLEEPRIGPSPFSKPRPRRPRVLPPFACFVRSAAASQAARGPQTTPPWAHTVNPPPPAGAPAAPADTGQACAEQYSGVDSGTDPRSYNRPDWPLDGHPIGGSRPTTASETPSSHGLLLIDQVLEIEVLLADELNPVRCREQRVAASSAWPRAWSRPSRLGSTCRTSFDQSRLVRQRGARRH